MKKTVTILTIVMAFYSCQRTSNELSGELTTGDIEKIQKVDNDYVEFSNKNDWDNLATLLTTDAVIFPPNDSEVMGRESNLDRFKSFGNVSIKYSHSLTSINGHNDLAYLQGKYDIQIIFPNSDQPYKDNGKHLWILKKQSDETWKIHRVIWNSSVKPTK